MAHQTTKTTTKTRTYAVLDRDFTYEFYERVTTKPAGTRLLLGRDGMGDRLTDGGDLVIILGHGVDELIPKDAFHLEDETTTKTTTVRTITARRA